MESNRKTEGTGLGLQIAKRLTEMMKGSISVESEYGKGSTFTVRIAQKFIADVHIGQEVVDSLKNFSYSDKKRGLYAQFKRISLPYARVLVVDDVVTNLEVARGFLKPYGMQVDCVSSGIQAIAAIRDASIRYNAVFMDHMMPEMNGIEATRIIREEIGTEYAKSIPIIALTANAIAGNEEMFLNKGFQAFLPKPIEIPRLDAVIRRWVRDTEQEKLFREMANGPNEIGRRTAAERKSVVDWQALSTGVSGLNMDKGIQYFGGDEGSYFTVLRTFAANTPLLLEKIATVTPDTMADYSIAVHGLRGSSRSICADDIANIAEALEHATKTDDYDFITAHNASLLEAAWKLVSEIDAMLLQIHVDTPKPCKDAPDKEVLSRIVEACKRYDMDTVDAAIKELESYEYKSGGELVPWLWKNAQLFNLEQIIEKLSE
jgi:CheY-like chemotaxis protein